MARRTSICAVVACLVIVLSGCSDDRSTSSAIELGAAATDAGWIAVDPVPVSLPVDQPLGDVAEPSKDGAVIVNIWASYCAPCVKEMPLLEEVARSGRVEVVGLTRDARVSYAEAAMRKAGTTYPNFVDNDATFAIALDGRVPLNAIPATVLVRDGVAVAVHVGELTSTADVLAVLTQDDA